MATLLVSMFCGWNQKITRGYNSVVQRGWYVSHDSRGVFKGQLTTVSPVGGSQELGRGLM